MTAAERMRVHRDRKRRGVVAVVPVEITMDAVQGMIEAGVLTTETNDQGEIRIPREEIARAVQEIISASG